MTHQQCYLWYCVITFFPKEFVDGFWKILKEKKIFLFKWDRYECMDGFLKVFLGLSAILDSVCVSSWEMTIICRLTIPYITIQLHFHQRTYICIKLYVILHWCAGSGHCPPPRPISIRDPSCKNYGNVKKLDQTLLNFDISMKRPFWIWSVQGLLAVSFQNDQKAWLWLTMMWGETLELRVPFEKSADQKNQLEQIELRDIQRRTWIRFETERWPSVSASYRKTHIDNSKTTIQNWILKPSEFVYRRRGLHQVNKNLKKLQLQLFSRHTRRLSDQTSSSPADKL